MVLPSLFRALTVGAVLLGAGAAAGLPPVVGALIGVVGGAIAATILLGSFEPAPIALGALGALAFTLLEPLSASVAFGALLAMLFSARALRASSWPLGVLLIALSLVGGAVGAAIEGAYAGAASGLAASAWMVAALVASVALLVPVDDGPTHALRRLAQSTSGVMRWRLLRAVAVRTRYAEVRPSLSRTARRRMERAFDALIRAARARQTAGRSSSIVLDARILGYVRALSRATAAALQARDLSENLDDAVLTELKLEEDDLSAQAEALAEAQVDV